MDWENLFRSSSKSLRSKFEEIREAVNHRGLKGNANEHIVSEFLERYLPSRIGFCTGEIIDSNGERSKQTDVLAFDAATSPKFFQSGDIKILPIESVYAVFEVKAMLNKSEIENAFSNMQRVKSLEKKAYFPNIRTGSEKLLYGKRSQHWPIQFFIFAFESDDLNTVLGHVQTLNDSQPIDKRIDTIFVLDKGLITNVSSRGLDSVPMPDTHLTSKPTENALLAFYALINTLLAQTDSEPVNINAYLDKVLI
jgi:hypothetical protein